MLLFSHPVGSHSLQPHGVQHARLPCPSLSHCLKLVSTELMIHTTHLILCRQLLPCPQSFPASRSFSVSQLLASDGQRIRASASVLPMNIQGCLPLALTSLIPAVQRTLKSLLQHHSLKASVLWCSAFLLVQLSQPYMTTGETIALTR